MHDAQCGAGVRCGGAGCRGRFRRRGFGETWDEALLIGYEKLEEEALSAACAGLSHAACDPDAPVPPMSGWQALHLLHLQKYKWIGIGKRPGAPSKVGIDAKVLDAITKRIAQMKREDEAARKLAERVAARRAARRDAARATGT